MRLVNDQVEGTDILFEAVIFPKKNQHCALEEIQSQKLSIINDSL